MAIASRKSRNAVIGSVSSVLGCILMCSSAFAQEASSSGDSSASAAEEATGQDIIVTAQKRSERLQDVPISIAAVTGATLDKAGIKQIDDLVAVTPGLNIQRQWSSTVLYIRGVGTQNGSLGEEANVATYVDGVYQVEPSANSFDFNNVERVEVLKGPQGTLFGRNATGGLINVITKDPSHTTALQADVSYGNYNTAGARLYATTGLSDSLAGDIAVIYSHQGDGFGKNLVTGNDINKNNVFAIRSKLVFGNSDAFKATFSGDYSKSSGSAGVVRRPVDGTKGIFGYVFNGGYYDIAMPDDPVAKNERWGASLRLDLDAGFAKFVSISAYRGSTTLLTYAQAGVPNQAINTAYISDNTFYSQELQLLSNGSGPFTWIAGAFVMRSESSYHAPRAGDLSGGLGDGLRLTGPLAVPGGGQRFIDTDLYTNSYSGFVDASYALTDQTKVTAGFRYTSDTRNIHSSIRDNGVLTGNPQLIYAKKTWNRPTWRFVIDHHFTNDTMIFASYNRGFKSGVFAASAPRNAPANPERIDAYEVGVKSDLLDRVLRLNLSGFYYKYKDIQLAVPLVGSVAVINAAAANIKGIDGELTITPTSNFTLKLAGTYTDGHYSSFPTGVLWVPRPTGGNAATTVNLTGFETIRSPKFAGSMTATYTTPLGGGELGLSGNLYHTGKFYWEADNRIPQKAYSLLSGEISWTTPDQRWQFRVFGRNLTNSRYSIYTAEGALGDLMIAGSPRTFGAGIKMMFGG